LGYEGIVDKALLDLPLALSLQYHKAAYFLVDVLAGTDSQEKAR
jgi:hypothetical protein